MERNPPLQRRRRPDLRPADRRCRSRVPALPWARVDGVVGPRTWGSLAWFIVARGDRGGFVAAAQVELTKNEYRVVVDGIFGPRTETAVRRAQCDLGLRVDGIVVPQTWRGLIPRTRD